MRQARTELTVTTPGLACLDITDAVGDGRADHRRHVVPHAIGD